MRLVLPFGGARESSLGDGNTHGSGSFSFSPRGCRSPAGEISQRGLSGSLSYEMVGIRLCAVIESGARLHRAVLSANLHHAAGNALVPREHPVLPRYRARETSCGVSLALF